MDAMTTYPKEPKEPNFEEIEQAREHLNEWLKSPFLVEAEDEQTEASIREFALMIGTAPTLRNRRIKLGMRPSVQIMIRMAIKSGVLMGLFIADHREQSRINEIRAKYDLPPYVPPPTL